MVKNVIYMEQGRTGDQENLKSELQKELMEVAAPGLAVLLILCTTWPALLFKLGWEIHGYHMLYRNYYVAPHVHTCDKMVTYFIYLSLVSCVLSIIQFGK